MIREIIDYKEVGRRLRALRVSCDMTLSEVAEKVMSTKSSLSRYENGEKQIPSNVLYQYSLFFNVSTDTILGVKPSDREFRDDEQVFKFTVDNRGINIFISHKDLEFICDYNPENFDGLGKCVSFKPDKTKDIAKYFIDGLKEQVNQDSNDTVLGQAFSEVFQGVLEGAEDELFYYHDDDHDDHNEEED